MLFFYNSFVERVWLQSRSRSSEEVVIDGFFPVGRGLKTDFCIFFTFMDHECGHVRSLFAFGAVVYLQMAIIDVPGCAAVIDAVSSCSINADVIERQSVEVLAARGPDIERIASGVEHVDIVQMDIRYIVVVGVAYVDGALCVSPEIAFGSFST